MTHESRRASLCMTLLLLAATSVSAQTPALGSSFQVNTFTDGDQVAPEVSTTADGRFVVVWRTDAPSPTSGVDFRVASRRFDSDGTPSADEVFVATQSTSPRRPSVGISASGVVAITWDESVDGPDDEETKVVSAQRFDADGALQGPLLEVDRSRPFILESVLAGEVVWSGNDNLNVLYLYQLAEGFVQTQGRGRQFPPGDDVGSEFDVTELDSVSTSMRPAATPNGGFVVSWSQGYSPGASYEVRTRFFDDAGVAGPVIDHATADRLVPTDVAVAEDGTTLLVWVEPAKLGVGNILGRVLIDQAPATAPFFIDELTGPFLRPLRVAFEGHDFIVVWESLRPIGTDDMGSSIQARRVARNGVPMGGSFQVNDVTLGDQTEPRIAAPGDAGGSFVVTWQSETSDGSDTDGTSIQARRFGFLLRDGFETGDLRFWSTVESRSDKQP